MTMTLHGLAWIFIMALVSRTSFAQESTLDRNGLVEMIEKANRISTRRQLDPCARESLPARASLEIERQSITDRFGRKLPISVVAQADLKRLRELYPVNLRVMDDEVCAQRAHTIGDTLAKAGIETQKLYLLPGGVWPLSGFIVPDDKVRSNRGTVPRWNNHVVNLINVKEGDGKIVQYVIDPFMEGLPVPRTKWEQRLRRNPESSIGSEEVISRYNFGPTDAGQVLESYDNETLEGSYRIMRGDKRR